MEKETEREKVGESERGREKERAREREGISGGHRQLLKKRDSERE